MEKIYKFSLGALCFLTFLLIFASSIKSFYNNNLSYVTAEYVKIYNEIDTFGVFLKEETLISRNVVGYTDLNVSSGEKVSKNQTLAYVYTDDSYVRLNNEIKYINDLISVLKTVDTTTNAKTSALINDAVILYNSYIDSNDIASYTGYANNIKLISTRRAFDNLTSEEVSDEISRLTTNVLEIEQDLLENQTQILFNESGYFIEGIDGYESVFSYTAEEILDMKKQNTEVKTSEDYMGKIVTDFNWQYVCVVTEEELSLILQTSSFQIIFDKLPQAVINITFENYVRDGEFYKVTFKGTSKQNELFKLRTSGARIILNTHYGIKIPKEATRIIDEKLGVYTISGSTQVFKTIEKTYEGHDFYLIAQKKNPTKNDIISGDKIVVNSKNIN